MQPTTLSLTANEKAFLKLCRNYDTAEQQRGDNFSNGGVREAESLFTKATRAKLTLNRLMKTTPYRIPEFNGTIARVAIQCKHPATGETGSWLYTGQNHKDPDSAVSPLFPNCYELFKWSNVNGFKSVGYDEEVYQGEGTHGKSVSDYMAKRHPNCLA